ncbi:hypothetical protein WAI453_009701 [Rhynchosporium graminicola]
MDRTKQGTAVGISCLPLSAHVQDELFHPNPKSHHIRPPVQMSTSAKTKALLPLWHAGPAFHTRAPSGWLNDPCGPAYDVTTGTYHVFYQWNPKDCD